MPPGEPAHSLYTLDGAASAGKLIVTRRVPRTLDAGQVAAILGACERVRDRFLFAPSALGASPGKAVFDGMADATVRSLLARVAGALARPHKPAGPEQETDITGPAARLPASEQP